MRKKKRIGGVELNYTMMMDDTGGLMMGSEATFEEGGPSPTAFRGAFA
jgi:hypothetical protein